MRVKDGRAVIHIETSKTGLRTGFSEVVSLKDGGSKKILTARCLTLSRKICFVERRRLRFESS